MKNKKTKLTRRISGNRFKGTCFLYQIEGSNALYCAEHAREVLES